MIKKIKRFNFKDLFILDIANNHQGDIKHGLNIIKLHSEIVKKNKIRAVFKFQFRELDTFIHPKFKNSNKNKYIPRFLSTRMDDSDFKVMRKFIKSNKCLAACTPFDELSVDLIESIGFDIIKIASCSANDWPLLERVSLTNKPVIISTGGLNISEIDKIVSFASHRNMDFALMHCVSIYPTPEEDSNLIRIAILKERFPDVEIGWSTHENPDDFDPIKIAKALGANIFERHIGLNTKKYKLNKYSSTPKQLNNWFNHFKKTNIYFGNGYGKVNKFEKSTLDQLKRGIFVNKVVKKNKKLKVEDIFYAFPVKRNQLVSGEFKISTLTKKLYKKNEALIKEKIKLPKLKKSEIISNLNHKIKAILNKAKINLGNDFNLEYSHHYGILKFEKIGCILIDCINREYCKKLLIQLPNQKHPFHYHKLKEETFHVLSGEIYINIEGVEKIYIPGDKILVLPGTWHSFRTKIGTVVEEVSTTHFNNDTIYKDPKINKLKREERKTVVKQWGRFEKEDLLDN
ncbi:N-acetylneuraminate synthase family protein [Alphaproteobacteria bacterium]|nr:N-acetylneuraminate synthase family protein [Alphaproteobacteria bacterium]